MGEMETFGVYVDEAIKIVRILRKRNFKIVRRSKGVYVLYDMNTTLGMIEYNIRLGGTCLMVITPERIGDI